MKILNNIFIVVFPVIFLNSCMGSLVLNETARTVGNSNHEVTVGFGYPYGESINYTYGLTNDVDIGLRIESLGIGIRSKYAFLNQRDEGASLAIAGGAGTTIFANYYYGDLIASYLTGAFEPYTAVRGGYVKSRTSTSPDTDSISNFVSTVGVPFFSSEYGYVQPFIGTRIWFNKNWEMSLEGSYIIIFDEWHSELSQEKNPFIYSFGISFGYRTN